VAAGIVATESTQELAQFTRALEDPNSKVATHAARVVEEVVHQNPALAAGQIARLVKLINSREARVVRTCANALPMLAGVAPAKVARHMATLKESYADATDVGKDGIVRTFVILCEASVAYQKRLIDVFEQALTMAEPETLLRWSTMVLPALKGEPHAQAREVVEGRLPEIPRSTAQKIAELVGVRLRPAFR
jgi:hypothetical protein